MKILRILVLVLVAVVAVVAIAAPIDYLNARDGGAHALLFGISMAYAVLACSMGLLVQARTLDSVEERARNLADWLRRNS